MEMVSRDTNVCWQFISLFLRRENKLKGNMGCSYELNVGGLAHAYYQRWNIFQSAGWGNEILNITYTFKYL